MEVFVEYLGNVCKFLEVERKSYQLIRHPTANYGVSGFPGEE